MFLAQTDDFPPSQIPGKLLPALCSDSDVVRRESVEDLEVERMPTPIEGSTFVCSRGFTEADWNEAYRKWKQAACYSSDSDLDPEYVPPKVATSGRHLCDGELSIADALELNFDKPDEVTASVRSWQ